MVYRLQPLENRWASLGAKPLLVDHLAPAEIPVFYHRYTRAHDASINPTHSHRAPTQYCGEVRRRCGHLLPGIRAGRSAPHYLFRRFNGQAPPPTQAITRRAWSDKRYDDADSSKKESTKTTGSPTLASPALVFGSWLSPHLPSLWHFSQIFLDPPDPSDPPALQPVIPVFVLVCLRFCYFFNQL